MVNTLDQGGLWKELNFREGWFHKIFLYFRNIILTNITWAYHFWIFFFTNNCFVTF